MYNIFKKKPKVEIIPLTREESDQLARVRQEYLCIKRNNSYIKIFKRLYKRASIIQNKKDRIKLVLSILINEKRRHNRTEAYLKNKIKELEVRDIMTNNVYYQEEKRKENDERMKNMIDPNIVSEKELEKRFKKEKRTKEELLLLKEESVKKIQDGPLPTNERIVHINNIYYVDWLIRNNKI